MSSKEIERPSSQADDDHHHQQQQQTMTGSGSSGGVELDTIKELYKYAMEDKWEIVVEKCTKNPKLLNAKLITYSMDTILHITVACYSDRKLHKLSGEERPPSLNIFDFEGVPADVAVKALSAENASGHTPLHLAAMYGNVELCSLITLKCHKLLTKRNKDGETPLFLAAHHGHMDAFDRLLRTYYRCQCRCQECQGCDKRRHAGTEDCPIEEKKKLVYGLCRRTKDGNTILHSAVSGEYYEIAHQIMEDYVEFGHFITVKGETPLFFLASKPNSFESSSPMGFLDHVVYWCVDVLDVKVGSEKDKIKCPKNYVTLVTLARLIRELIQKGIGWPWNLRCLKRADQGNSSCDHPHDEENVEEEKKEEAVKQMKFPPTYTTLINILKLLFMATLIVLGLGVGKIKKLKQKRDRHTWANKIMKKMVEHQKTFFYFSDGETQPDASDNHLRPEGFVIPQDHPLEEETDDDDHPKKQIMKRMVEHQKNFFYFSDDNHHPQKQNVEKMTTTKESIHPHTVILKAAKTGIVEIVKEFLETFHMAVYEVDSEDKNILLLAIENRHTHVFDFLIESYRLPEFTLKQVDKNGNSARHLAGVRGPPNSWALPGVALQMHGESSWYKYVHDKLPEVHYAQYNNSSKKPREMFSEEHEKLRSEGAEWLIKTSESCSLVAALIATVAFATSVSVPGGVDENTGRPKLENAVLFNVFSIASLMALCFSLTSLVFFLSIITSRCQVWDFEKRLPWKLIMGLSCLLSSIAVILVSFCTGHYFVLSKDLEFAAVPIYTVAAVPLTIFAFSNVRLYFDLVRALCARVPRRSY